MKADHCHQHTAVNNHFNALCRAAIIKWTTE
jgi:hypothetical protein